MERVYCLYRVSTKGQVDEDDIPMQRKACHVFAEKMGWTICKEFLEKGVSGFKISANDRDAIQDLRAAAEKKEFDILLVFMFDRLGRIPNETPFVLEWFVKSGIQVWSTKEGQQTFENDCDYLLNYIRFWQAGGESRKTSLRVKTRLGQLVEEGKFTGGAAAFGYRFVKSGTITKKGRELVALEIIPEEAAVVQYIFQKTVNEGYGTWRLCNLINEQGFRTHNGARFQSNTINRILRNEVYTGHYVRGGKRSELIEGLQIISEDMFAQAQKILEARNVVNARKSNIAYTTRGAALLGGNIYCAHCGARLHACTYSAKRTLADGTEKVYHQIKYVCPNRARRRGPCDGLTEYTSTRIDEAVLAVVHDLLDKIKGSVRTDALERSYKEALRQKRADYNRLLKEHEELGLIIQRLHNEIGLAMIGKSRLSLEDINQSLVVHREKIAQLERLIPETLKAVNAEQDTLKNLDARYEQFLGFAEEFDSATRERKKMIICDLLERIEIGKLYRINVLIKKPYLDLISDF